MKLLMKKSPMLFRRLTKRRGSSPDGEGEGTGTESGAQSQAEDEPELANEERTKVLLRPHHSLRFKDLREHSPFAEKEK